MGQKREPFRFPDATRNQLKALLGNRPELIATLERITEPYQRQGPSRSAQYAARQRRGRPELQSLDRSLRAVTAALESLDPDVGQDVETGIDGLFEFQTCRPDPLEIDLASLASHVNEVHQVVSWLLEGSYRGLPRGRPKTLMADRVIWVGSPVATALARAGIEVTSGRDGDLGRTLSIVLDACGLDPPVDIFPIAREVVRLRKKAIRMNTELTSRRRDRK